MESIVQKDRNRCYLCGRVRTTFNPLDEHHVYFGPARPISERYGLKVYLCHFGCHLFSIKAVHNNAKRCRELQADVQRIAMEHYGWTVADFVRIVGRNYTEENP